MDTQKTRTWAEISLSAIEHNCRTIRAAMGADCTFLGVVKADAYGHGAAKVSEALRKAGVAFELHIYEKGPHGKGLFQGHPWAEECVRWLNCF